MTTMLSTVWTLVLKECRLESRGKEVVTLLLCSNMMMSALVGAGLSSAIVEQAVVSRLFPTILWVLFLLSTTTALARSNEAELEGRGFEGLLLLGVSGSSMYSAKVVVTAALLFFGYAVSCLTLGLFLGQSIGEILPLLLGTGGIISIGVGSLLVLLAGIASTSRLRGVLLPILAVPLLFPLFFAGVELTADIVHTRTVDPSSVWLSLAVGADVFYFLLGINLYEASLRD